MSVRHAVYEFLFNFVDLPFKAAIPNSIFENCEQDMSVITIKQDPEEYLRTFEKSGNMLATS